MKNWRLRLTFGFFCLSFTLIVARLFEIQILKNDYYKALAEKQHWISRKLPARRGRIFSRDGFPLVINAKVYLLYAEPQKIKSSGEVAETLADVLFEDGKKGEAAEKKTLQEELEKKLELNLFWVALVHGISPRQKEKIESFGFSGLGFKEESSRVYPEGKMAAHLLGFVGSDSRGREHGYYGLEGYYDGDLRGRGGEVSEEKGASGKPILVGGYHKMSPKDGEDLVLTINRSLQFSVEKKLSSAVLKYGAKSGTVVVMDPETGAILAMASFPAYDPSHYKEVFEKKSADEGQSSSAEDLLKDRPPSFLDPAVSVTFEPGSVLKILTMAAAIDTGTVTPETEFYDEGPIEVSGHWIHTWNNKYHGRENMVEVLQHSCNVGAAWVGLKLTAPKLREYFLKFGLGSLTGISLEGEATGLVKPLSQWRDIDLATAAFGQGVSVTPLQLVNAFSAIAHGGVMMRPYVVAEIRDGSAVIPFKSEEIRRVVSRESAKVLVEMLTAAAEEGEAKYFILKRYRVAGKTGTAQIPVGGKYSKKTNATFVGFLSNHPKFVMLTKLEEPSSSIYAAETAVPLWMDIAKDLIGYFGIPPDR